MLGSIGTESGLALRLSYLASSSSVYFPIVSVTPSLSTAISCPRPVREPSGFAVKRLSTWIRARPFSGVTKRQGSLVVLPWIRREPSSPSRLDRAPIHTSQGCNRECCLGYG
ncbi:hypothetical protein M427DRAFT_370354 [Gonapodya prolifera JEL478]|uniref:Uncharacterized protein n=1 Tax=Gonapodya prolifera (strain JEL478) TaxID=1344416 RepID=A0A139AAE8_GONPJ|nr:hypothetical protein M427DRAFT_370354 [Gonapodya prolifera JEL478]|eukprot:KXS13343.1 hypothetical protein M427DRAFT_370354 [Gonapodya prolifera JEL478]